MPNVKTEITNKYNELMHERIKTIQDISYLETSLKNISKQLGDCLAAARLFGIDLEENKSIPYVFSADKVLAFEQSKKSSEKPTIRDYCLETLRKSYPRPLRAKSIQADYETAHATKLHSKSVGMTLYRLSEEDRIRREGWDWYYIPTPDEQSIIDEMREE